MKMEQAVTVWQAVVEWERDTFGTPKSSMTFPSGSTEVEIRLSPDFGAATLSDHREEIDLLGLGDVVAGFGAGLYLHSTGGLVIR